MFKLSTSQRHLPPAGFRLDLQRRTPDLEPPRLVPVILYADVTSNTNYDWLLDHDYIVLAATAVVEEFLESFKVFRRARKLRPSHSTRHLRQ